MADYVPIRSIKTSDYVKVVKVNIDGNEWTMRPIGAADEMALSQAERRVELYDNKLKAIKEGTATKEDIARHEEYLDRYEGLEDRVVGLVCSVFNDGTDDNSQVKEWVRSIPLSVVFKIIEDIATQQADYEQAKDKSE